METRALQVQRSLPRPGRVFEIAQDVACLELSLVNILLVGRPGAGDRAWVLVDAGLTTSGPAIAREAAERFGHGARPSAIVLTHGHFDHRGALRELADLWDVPVYAHRLELPYLTGRSDYPPPDPTVGGGAVAMLLSRAFPKRPIDISDRIQILPEDGSVPGMPGWRWIHTPGHTPGHVAFFRDADSVLIAGDAFVTTRQESLTAVMSRKQEVWRPPAYFTPDWESARESVRALARLNPTVAATGHGIPMSGYRLRRELDDLAANFDEVIPSHGRYVDQPALADEQGVIAVPPRPFDPLLPALVGLGVLAFLGTRFRRDRYA